MTYRNDRKHLSELDHQFFIATEAFNAEEIAKQVDAGASINARDEYGQTPLLVGDGAGNQYRYCEDNSKRDWLISSELEQIPFDWNRADCSQGTEISRFRTAEPVSTSAASALTDHAGQPVDQDATART